MATENGETRVKYGQLTEPLKSYRAAKGTKMGDFCEKRGIEFGAAIRVNGDAVKADTVLKDGDIITNIDNVNGGQ